MHCPVCVYDAERMAPVPNWGFWWRCGSCRLEFVQPMRLSKSPQVLFESAYRGGMHENAMDEFRRRVTQRSSVLKEPSLWFWTPAFGRVFEWLEVRLKPGATVLELGCGLGIVLHELQGRGFKVHGLDVAELAVNLNRNDGFPVWHGPLESMPDDWMAKPDAVIAFFMLHHLEDSAGIALRMHKSESDEALGITRDNTGHLQVGLLIVAMKRREHHCFVDSAARARRR